MSTSFVWPAKLLALHLLTTPNGSTGDHSEVSMLINQNYYHGPKQEKHILCFLLGNSPASEFYMPTFQNTLSVPSSEAPMKMEQRQCFETLVYKIQTLRNYPEESIQHSEHGESLKSRRKA